MNLILNNMLAVNKIKFNELILKETFENNWDSVLLIDSIKNQKITYQEFFGKILQLKERLSEIGVKKGDFLCVILENSVDLVTIYFSSLILGTIVVPIDPEKGTEEINEILNQFPNKKIISHENFLNNAVPFIKIDDLKTLESIKNFKDLTALTQINFEKVFLITFTSGTSGIQKGVMHSFKNLIQSANAFKKKFNFGNNHVFLHNLPMTYMAGILNLLILPMISNSKIVISERTNASNIMNFWDTAKKFSANSFWLNPTFLELLIKLDRSNLGIEYAKENNVTVCVGTAPLNDITKKNFEKKYKIKIFESYGLSETLFVSTNFPNNDKISSVGKLLDNIEIKFENDEILINSPWMFLGYYNSEEKSYKNGFFNTGDLGKIDSDEFLYIVGRKKDIIIKGGMNISPRKIENFLTELGVFNEVAILGFPSRLLGEKIVCISILGKMEKSLAKKTVNKKIIKKLGIHHTVDEFIFVENIPKNLNAKIDKPKIIEMLIQKINDS